MVGRGGDQRGLDVHRLWDEQRLAGAAARAQALEQAVVQNALMRGVLVDEDQPVRAFGNKVARSRLADGTQDSIRRVTVGLRVRDRSRGLVQGELRSRHERGRGRSGFYGSIAERITSIEG